jgi:hypothetical protein
MENLGQYLGYIIFLCGILFAYNFDKKVKRWLYFFIATTSILIGLAMFQNRDLIASTYRALNGPFHVDISTSEAAPSVLQIINATGTTTP